MRGFALCAILLVHNVEHYIFSVYPEASSEWLTAMDGGVNSLVFTLFGGKAYAIFSLLFGFTFYVQYENQRLRGRDFGYRFLWRLVGLVLLATIDAAFFPGGDILLLYAVVGVVLFVVRKWSNRAILIAAILFFLQPMELYHAVASLVDSSHQLPDYGAGASLHYKVGNIWQHEPYELCDSIYLRCIDILPARTLFRAILWPQSKSYHRLCVLCRAVALLCMVVAQIWPRPSGTTMA